MQADTHESNQVHTPFWYKWYRLVFVQSEFDLNLRPFLERSLQQVLLMFFRVVAG